MKPVGISVQRFVCVDSDCRQEVDFVAPVGFGDAKPKCICGAEMKRPYVKPQFRERTWEPDVLKLFSAAVPSQKPVK